MTKRSALHLRLNNIYSPRHDSGIWNAGERNYDATKRECRGVLKALKKVRNQLYRVHFVLESDAGGMEEEIDDLIDAHIWHYIWESVLDPRSGLD